MQSSISDMQAKYVYKSRTKFLVQISTFNITLYRFLFCIHIILLWKLQDMCWFGTPVAFHTWIWTSVRKNVYASLNKRSPQKFFLFTLTNITLTLNGIKNKHGNPRSQNFILFTFINDALPHWKVFRTRHLYAYSNIRVPTKNHIF